MNPTNFDWLNQIPTNNNDGGMILQSLGMEPNDLATNDLGGEQDIVKYLFDNAQFSVPLDPQATSPQSTHTAGSDSPKSVATTTVNSNPSVFDNSWLTSSSSVNPQSSFTIIHQTNTTAPQPASTSRKMRIKKKREPIFVTESPQNAYKKKNKKSSAGAFSLPPIDEKEQQNHQQQDSSSSPSSPFDDDDDMDINEPLDKQHLTSKERRQLRNKISARNFRVRRKEYISQLENKVDEQDDAIDSLKEENKRLTGLNEQLLQEVMELRLQLQQRPSVQYQQPALTVSPPSSDTNSPPDLLESLLDFNLFNNPSNNSYNTYLSHTLMPDFDLSNVLGDKLAHPPSSTRLEEHGELMTMYPLLAPALASIVIRHTFSLHYVAYLTSNFPYDSRKNEVLDIMHPDDWVTAASSLTSCKQGDDDDPKKNPGDTLMSTHLVEKSADEQEDGWTREMERKILKEHYPYYAFMRLRGLSHEEIMRRCKACMEHRVIVERQRRVKAATCCSKFQTLHAFTSVAAALIRNPSRSPMIAGVMQETKACRPKNGKAKLMVTAPLRAALRIANKS